MWTARTTRASGAGRWHSPRPSGLRYGTNAQVLGERGTTVLENGDRMPGAHWFPQARSTTPRTCCAAVMTPTRWFSGVRTSSGVASRTASSTRRSRAARKLCRPAGVGQGDRVAAYLPNMPEALIAMLASRLARRDLVVRLARLWRPGRSSTVSGRSNPRSCCALTPTGTTASRSIAWPGTPKSPLRCQAWRARWSFPTSTMSPQRERRSEMALRYADFVAPFAARLQIELCAAAFRSPAVHHVLLGHHRRSQVHRARPRRRPAATSQGTPVARRRQPTTGFSTSPPAAG
jgi:hypothetical protein